MVTLSSPAKGRTIMYALGGSKKATAYTAPVNLRAGGSITTWYKDNPAMKTSMTYAKVESVPLQVVLPRRRSLVVAMPHTLSMATPPPFGTPCTLSPWPSTPTG